jgi:hypothetical protein
VALRTASMDFADRRENAIQISPRGLTGNAGPLTRSALLLYRTIVSRVARLAELKIRSSPVLQALGERWAGRGRILQPDRMN